jgi:hypothetical protein
MINNTSMKDIKIKDSHIFFNNRYRSNSKPYKRKLYGCKYFIFDGFMYRVKLNKIDQVAIADTFKKGLYSTMFKSLRVGDFRKESLLKLTNKGVKHCGFKMHYSEVY